jgi:hypothetical protein
MLDAKDQRGLVRREMWRSVMAPNTPAHEPAFLPLWKDADPDIPILKEAIAEYAKLQKLLELEPQKWHRQDRCRETRFPPSISP